MIRRALFLLLLIAAVRAGGAEVTLLDGTTIAGQITAWDDQQLTVETDAGPREIARAELLDVRWPDVSLDESPLVAAAAKGIGVVAVDGTQLVATEFNVSRRRAAIATPLADRPLVIPVERIDRVALRPASEASAAIWRQLEESAPAGDVLLVTGRDGAKLDYLTGVVGDVTADEVAFDYDGQHVQVKRARVAGVGYYHAEPPRLPEAVCELTVAPGATIPVRALALDGKQLRVTTPAGIRLTLPIVALMRADFSAGKLAYLSDVKPTEVVWTPRIAAPAAASLIANYGAPRNDVSFTGSALTLAWNNDSAPSGHEVRAYTKGIAFRSRTDATWRVPAGMKRFTATAGIDPATTDQGHVVLEIRADDRVLWEGEIDGHADPVPIDVELGSARRLQIRVDYGRNLDFGDRLHLVDARLTK
jgi:hypothetical protein